MSNSCCRKVGDRGSETLMLRFGDMDYTPVASLEELGLSPPTSQAPFGGSSNDGGESSEDWEDHTSCLAEEIAHSMLRDDDESDVKARSRASPKPAWRSQMACSPSSPLSTLAAVGGYNWEAWNADSSSSGLSSPPTPVAVGSSTPGDECANGLYAELLRVKLEGETKFSRGRETLQEQTLKRQALFSPMDSPDERGRGQMHAVAMANDGCQQDFVLGKQGGGRGGRGVAPLHQGYDDQRNCNSTRSNCAATGSVRHRLMNGYVGWDAAHRIHETSRNRSGSNRNSPTTVRSPTVKGGGSGMRAMFLMSSTSRERGGTGVFLPRRLGSFPDSIRKPACSTVLLPSRVVHALNLNVEDTLPSPLWRDQSYWPHPSSLESEALEARAFPSSTQPSSALQEIAPDIRLPSEWTY